MESITPPPPYHRSDPKSRTKSASHRLSRINQPDPLNPLNISLELLSSPSTTTFSPRPHKIRQLLLLSPSPHKNLKTHLPDQDPAEADPKTSRRRHKTRNSLVVSPKYNNNRRSRRNSGRPKKEKLNLVSSISSHRDESDGYNLDRIGQLMIDLIMWNDVAKSSLWFGFGSLCFLSSSFSSGLTFSALSMICQLGLLVLVLAFFSSSVGQRNITEKRDVELKEDDILKAARLVLPAANLAICKIGGLFSGDPSTTLKVAPFLLIGAEYGHLLSLWNLCALGFFLSFTGPKLYTSYSSQINDKVEFLRCRVLEAWGACSHKKIVAASAVTAFWNLTSMKTRIFAAFISLVIFRYHRHYSESQEGEKETDQEAQQALVLVESGSHK